MSFALLASEVAGAAPPARKDKQIDLQNAWEECVFRFVDGTALANREPAQVIAESAMTACKDPENDLFAYFKSEKDPVVRNAVLDQIFPAIKEYYYKEATARVLVLRSGRTPPKKSGQAL